MFETVVHGLMEAVVLSFVIGGICGAIIALWIRESVGS